MVANEPANEELIRKVKGGNEQAFTLLMNRWHKRIFNYAYRYGNCRVFAQEVVQQTFIQVYQKLDQLQELERFVPWLYRIASNCCHSERRSIRNKNALVSVAEELPDRAGTVTPANLYEKEERRGVVRMVLQEIPEKQREVIILKEYEGLKFREIADALGESENTVKSRLYYGLEAMRKQIIQRRLKEEIYHGS